MAISSPLLTSSSSARSTRTSRPASKKLLSSPSALSSNSAPPEAAAAAAASGVDDPPRSFIADDLDRRERSRLECRVERRAQAQDHGGRSHGEEVYRVQPHRHRAYHEHIGWQMDQMVLADEERGEEAAQHPEGGSADAQRG